MVASGRHIPAGAVRGHASGVIFMAFFGTLWASIGAGGLGAWGTPWTTIAVLSIGAALLVGGVALWRGAGRLGDAGSGDGDGPPMGRSFWVIFGLEGAAIFIASIVCNAIGRFDLFFPIMAIIVGIHFLPLARLFGIPLYYAVGTLLCLIGLICLVAVPVQATLGTHDIMARALIVGFGCAVILWGVGLLLWWRGGGLLRRGLSAA